LPAIIRVTSYLVILINLNYCWQLPALAQDSESQKQPLEFKQPDSFSLPDIGEPPRRQGGGTRGSLIPIGNILATAIVPENNVGFTIAEHPTIFAYIPQFDRAIQRLDVELIDPEDHYIEKTELTPTKGGIIGFTFNKAKSLLINQRYTWQIIIVFDDVDPSEEVLIRGWIQRVEISPDLRQKLATAREDKIPTIYADAGIWYDALSSLAQLRQKYPDEPKYRQQWGELLQSVGLGELADKPILDTISVIEQQENNPENKNDNNSIFGDIFEPGREQGGGTR
jgi:hypothetical protein